MLPIIIIPNYVWYLPVVIRFWSSSVHVLFVITNVAKVRLVGGNGVYTGRVEVYYSNTWGTVCHNGWSLNDAAVVCRELGFPGAVSSSCCAAFGQGTGPAWLDEVGCTGSETSLSSCSHRGWGRISCSHREDAGVNCQGEYKRISRVWHNYLCITVDPRLTGPLWSQQIPTCPDK